jgi:MATE family multidrug resistance protein
LAWALVVGIVIGVVYLVAGDMLATIFSTNPEVIAATGRYIGWTALLAVVGVFVSVFDGIFVGAGWTRAMVVTMAGAMAVYAAALYLFEPLGNAGLWLAFTLLFVVRTAGQLYLLPGLVRRDLG